MNFGKRIVKDIIIWLGIVALAHFIFIKTNPHLAEASLHANNEAVTKNSIIAEKARLGLNDPWPKQFSTWLGNAIHGNFGYAIYAIKNPNTHGEKGIRLFLLSGSAIPSFWLGLILLTIFAMDLTIFPISSDHFSFFGLVLPTITLAAAYIGSYIRLMRRELLQLRRKEYIRYYRYQGLSEQRLSHIMIRNAMSSLLVSLSVSIPKILAGSAVVETLFSWPGMGYMCITAINDRDFPVIQGYIAVMAVVFLVFNELCWFLNQRFILARR